jgi:hypothetical protein
MVDRESQGESHEAKYAWENSHKGHCGLYFGLHDTLVQTPSMCLDLSPVPVVHVPLSGMGMEW